MKKGGDARESESGDKNGGIETGIAFLLFIGFSTILIEEGVGLEDWSRISNG
jgi:Flp pilus assembly protein TadG